jgi:hypothetical protein
LEDKTRSHDQILHLEVLVSTEISRRDERWLVRGNLACFTSPGLPPWCIAADTRVFYLLRESYRGKGRENLSFLGLGKFDLHVSTRGLKRTYGRMSWFRTSTQNLLAYSRAQLIQTALSGRSEPKGYYYCLGRAASGHEGGLARLANAILYAWMPSYPRHPGLVDVKPISTKP